MAVEQMTRHCSLKAVLGKAEACPEARCPFWEPGGAALSGRCAVEELGVVADAPLATWLLQMRDRLEAAGSVEEERTLRGVFHQLLNDSSE